ncbi:UNVERIFIED_CONTAM: hypothetical protein FKN15_048351 [Acipenser sinensis]
MCFCGTADPEKSELETAVNELGQGVWIMIWVAVFLVAMVFSVTLLLRVFQKNKSRQDFYKNTEADKQKRAAVGSEGDSLFRVTMETGSPARKFGAVEAPALDEVIVTRNEANPHDGDITAPYPSCLPVPATEEGATILVTTKTAQFCSCALDSTGGTVLGTQQNDAKRQHLLERLLDAVKQCQIRFGGKKEIASDSDSRVICLCAQFEAVLLHGLRRSRGLALTAATIKQVAGFSNKSETELSFWFYVKEHLNRHELQRFYSLHSITSEVGRGRAWLRCALNEHSLERSLHMLLSDRTRLGAFYEDWAFIMDEERASMLPTMAAGLNSILFAIQIDNTDLNGQNRAVPSVSHLLKESTQGVSSLWKESTQGVSTLLRELTTTASSNTRPEQEAEPLPVLPRSTSAKSRLKKERKKKKKVTNIISFDDDDEGGDEEEEYGVRKSGKGRASSEEMERHDHSPMLNGVGGWGGGHTFYGLRMDTKSIDNEEEEDEELYGKAASRGELEEEPLVGSLSSLSTCSPLQVLNDNDSSDILLPVSTGDAYSQSEAAVKDQGYREEQDNATLAVELAERVSQLQFSMEDSPPVKNNTIISMLPPTVLPESMTVTELRQAIVAMMNRKDELEDQNSSLRCLLDGEMEHSAAVRQELDSLKKRLAELEERHAGKVQALGRENEVLKVQLKKYVGAVQMLKREGGQTNDGEYPRKTYINSNITLTWENEVLKVQLKKYVGAVQMLKREGGQTNDAPRILEGENGCPASPAYE